MTIEALAAQASSQNATATGEKKTIAENFDVFLKLLTTQLKNQNPLEPVKTNEFTQQMVAFTGVEQQVKMNKSIESLGQIFQQSSLASSVSYIGKTVTADGATTNLDNGNAKWEVNFKQLPKDSKIVIYNEAKKPVYSTEANFNSGMNSFNWNGKGNSGQDLPNGLYTIKILAKDAGGRVIVPDTLTSGVVTGVDMTGKTGMLILGDRSVKIENVRKIT